jgi:hypothetical protein
VTFEYEEKQSRSRFVDVFWHTHDTSDVIGRSSPA